MASIPEWLKNNPYLIKEPEWHLSNDAPEELKEKFNEWVKHI